MVSQERLKEMFEYKDGDLIRKIATSTCVKVGDVAGSMDRNGYLTIRIDGRLYYNHRLVFMMFNGYFPEGIVDHKDKDRKNNKIENLREVSSTCNLRNSKQPCKNTSGVKGVYLCINKKGIARWHAKIGLKGGCPHIYSSIDFDEAVAHRLAAEQCLDWAGCDSSSPAFQYMQKILGKKP